MVSLTYFALDCVSLLVVKSYVVFTGTKYLTLHVRCVYTSFCKTIDLITCKVPKSMSAAA